MSILLNLTINRRWFDMIASGEKREEYRSADNRQVKNAWERVSDGEMILRNGYRLDSPALVVHVYGIVIRDGNDFIHPEWGEPTDRLHFAIMLGDVLVRGTYAEVKEWLEKGDGNAAAMRAADLSDINKEIKK